ncbi:6-carboxytetrahydropterin synthase QueD [Streptococcus loxodontisalivarius]|uniref:6-carboxy-5,6,7,8-tetrahydropterin synthase n=1 Tax=Streptococcus loxodontisalivarius TaxID=1349415 RepID=A0ABS2PPM4_9STRE|nr:6-carboxytetrahydropterin synthase QueD [Streptococcus loxodontisalivarius]MBM7641979.1 6-pyruvoyltetrahydropterin/6-carboxytetrahydropterin synthase [Streptococcus loxodontisalivarius]
MFFAPKEIKEATGESLIYCQRRVMVSKEFTFDAAHHLFNYEGKCKALHGHTYRLQIAVSGFLDERGMVYDFGDLKAIYKTELEPKLDHRYLNESLPYMNTTAENMVYWIYQTFAQALPNERGLQIEHVRLYETPSSYAEFRREWEHG